MSKITFDTFIEAIHRYFEPLAKEHGWPLVHLSEEVFEIKSPLYSMLIRFGVGLHNTTIDAILVPTGRVNEVLRGEFEGCFGILAIAIYNDLQMEIMPKAQSAEGFLEYTEYLSNKAKDLGIPYMLGQKSDAEKVKECWRKDSEKEIQKIRAYKL